MEPLPPRHRHGRNQHSSARNAFASSASPSFSLEGPYDDVSLSKGGKKSKFGVHEYAEIFAGSSSIPVLDLSILDERVRSGELRSARLDYSNIFGGLRNDEVAVPYEELLGSAAAKKTKMQIPNDAPSMCPESDSPNSSGKTRKSSDEAADQSIDGMKQQFNISFNKTSQINSDDFNGKTHIAQLHAVPAFTHFVDRAPPLQKKGGDSHTPASSLKREVSRTWSFNVGVNNGSTCPTSHVPDKPGNSNEINLRPCSTEVLSPTSDPCNPTGENDPRDSEFPSFDSKDVFKRADGENPLPFFDEELDENSVAAVSAAALKKAIEQAQESIRIARMIMERQKETIQGGSKPWSKDKNGSGIDSVVDVSMDNDARESYKKLDALPLFTGSSGKLAPSLNHTGRFLHAGRVDVNRVSPKVEAEKGHGDASSDVGKRFAASCSQSGTCYSAESEKFALEDVGTAEGCREVINITGLGGANGECSSGALELGKVESHDKLLDFPDKLQSHLEEMETVTRNLEQLSSHQTKRDETIAELAERDLSNSDSVQGIGMMADDALVQIKETGNIVKGAEVIAESSEKVLHSSESVEEQEMIVNDIVENLSIMQEEEVMREREDVSDIKLNQEKKFVEHLTVHRFDFNDLMRGLRCLAEKDMLGMKGIENPSRTYPERKGNGQHGKQSDQEKNKVMHQEAHPCLESKRQLQDSLDVEISDREPKNLPAFGVDGRIISVVHQPEMDRKKWHIECDRDEDQSARKDEQCETVEWDMDTSEFEAAETTEMEQKSEVAWEAEEIMSTHGGAEKRKEKGDKFDFQDAAFEEDISKVDDACDNAFGTISSYANSNDSSNISSVIKEPCGLNDKAEEYRTTSKGCEEDGSLTRVADAFSSAQDKEPGKLFHQEVNEMPGTDHSLRRCASEENFIGSKLTGAFEGFSSDSSTENAGLVDEGTEGKLPRPEDLFNAASKINNVAEEEAAEIVLEDFPDFCPNSKATEFDHGDVMLELGQTSESITRSVSSSVLEEITGGSGLESQECTDDEEDHTSNKEEVKHGFDMTSDGRDSVEEHRERLSCENEEVFSQPNGEAKEVENSVETRREVEPGKNMEINEKNPSGPSTIKLKDARGKWEKVEENDRQQRIEAIKKGREREKDRKAVERAIREARERAFAEAREKAERAAVERAAAEVRQRVLAEAQEKLEKHSMDSKPSADKLSTEAKIRTERAAVERATAEARERALEKAMSLNTYKEARAQAERYSTERLPSSSRDKGLKHSFSSSDLEKFDETTSESAQRRKARLERHQRIMERAAKALAEKNKRDLLAQKEQAEKNRLAETLDAEIKRWAGGKEGNLRALLSTLQYILGPDSGWQPTSLTEIITTAAVKKAYRRATLCVHPDKLQQRGASIQQKYICEKVFDLLKAAWNRFNSEEN